MSLVLVNSGPARFTVPAGAQVAIYSDGPFEVIQGVRGANAPVQGAVLFRRNGGYLLSGVISASLPTPVEISGGALYPVYYSVGTSPVVQEYLLNAQPTPGVLNATGTLTAALIYTGIVTSTTAAAVTATLDTGALMEASASWVVDDAFSWSAINTGGANAFTVQGSAGHTLVGSGTVAANSSGQFRTRKTDVNTYVTYRV